MQNKHFNGTRKIRIPCSRLAYDSYLIHLSSYTKAIKSTSLGIVKMTLRDSRVGHVFINEYPSKILNHSTFKFQNIWPEKYYDQHWNKVIYKVYVYILDELRLWVEQ